MQYVQYEEVEFYEKDRPIPIWVVIIVIILLWPVGIVLLLINVFARPKRIIRRVPVIVDDVAYRPGEYLINTPPPPPKPQ